MEIVSLIPGATTAGDDIAITDGAPDIDAVMAAEIERMPTALLDHPPGDIVAALAAHPGADFMNALAVHPDTDIRDALDDHSAVLLAACFQNHAQADVVDAILNHPVHNHDILVGAAGAPADVYGAVAGGTAHIVAAAVNLVVGAGATGIRNNAAVQAHAVGANPVAHVGIAALAHAEGIAMAHGNGINPMAHGAGADFAHVAADPEVGAVPSIVTTRTFELDVNTLLGDVVTLYYLAVGERVPAS